MPLYSVSTQGWQVGICRLHPLWIWLQQAWALAVLLDTVNDEELRSGARAELSLSHWHLALDGNHEVCGLGQVVGT